jgi:hypothetical protein
MNQKTPRSEMHEQTAATFYKNSITIHNNSSSSTFISFTFSLSGTAEEVGEKSESTMLREAEERIVRCE